MVSICLYVLCRGAVLYLQVVETRCKKVCTSKSDLRSNDFSIVGSLPRDFELSNFDCYGKPIEVANALGKSQNKNNKKPPPAKPVIPSAAKRIDLYARALFPFTFLFFNVIYWSVYLWDLCQWVRGVNLWPLMIQSEYGSSTNNAMQHDFFLFPFRIVFYNTLNTHMLSNIQSKT